MGFLHKLWDETLAGPAPETGLGKLRKYDSFSSATASRSSTPVVGAEEMFITRSITILKNNSNFKNLSIDPGSAPDSPASSTCTPRSPFSPGTPRGEFKKWTRRKSSADALEHAEPRSPTAYDWIVISALDR